MPKVLLIFRKINPTFRYINYTKIIDRVTLWDCENYKNLKDLKFAFLIMNIISVTIKFYLVTRT